MVGCINYCVVEAQIENTFRMLDFIYANLARSKIADTLITCFYYFRMGMESKRDKQH